MVFRYTDEEKKDFFSYLVVDNDRKTSGFSN